MKFEIIPEYNIGETLMVYGERKIGKVTNIRLQKNMYKYYLEYLLEFDDGSRLWYGANNLLKDY